MSVDARRALSELDPFSLSDAAWRVAYVIADTVDGERIYRQTAEILGARTGKESTNVRKILRELVRAGVLSVAERGGGRGNPTHYRWELETATQGHGLGEKTATHKPGLPGGNRNSEDAKPQLRDAKPQPSGIPHLIRTLEPNEPRAEASSNGQRPALADPPERSDTGHEITKQTIRQGMDEPLADPSVFAEARRRLGGVKVPTPKRKP